MDDAKEGRGVLQYVDGERYDGEWRADKAHGQGTLTYASGDQYVGAWRDGMKDGDGRLQYANGDAYPDGHAGLSHGVELLATGCIINHHGEHSSFPTVDGKKHSPPNRAQKRN